MTRGTQRSLAILCAFEDRAFEDIVRPLMDRILTEAGVAAGQVQTALTHGCRWGALARIGRDEQTWPDLLLVGADTRGESPARKRKAMKPNLARVLPQRLRDRCFLALPRPCAEAWLQADLSALRRGVAETLGEPMTLPADTGSYPRDEQQAKDRLRSLFERSGVPTLRGGLEFGPAVARHLDFDSERSLKAFAADLRHWLDQPSIRS